MKSTFSPLYSGCWNGLVNMYTLTNGIDKFAIDAALIKSINISGNSTNLFFLNKRHFPSQSYICLSVGVHCFGRISYPEQPCQKSKDFNTPPR